MQNPSKNATKHQTGTGASQPKHQMSKGTKGEAAKNADRMMMCFLLPFRELLLLTG
jgi:hypothetical protein